MNQFPVMEGVLKGRSRFSSALIIQICFDIMNTHISLSRKFKKVLQGLV